MKKSSKIILAILVVLVLLGGVGGIWLHNIHRQETAREIVDIQLETATIASTSLQPGEAITLDYTVTNNGYLPAELREILVLTLYDSQGTPLPLDTMAQKPAAVDLFYPEQSTGPTKAIQGNQAVYAVESFSIAGAEREYAFLFPGEDTPVMEGVSNLHTGALQLLLDPQAELTGCAVCVDVIIQSNENGVWNDLVSAQIIFAEPGHTIHSMAHPGGIPELTNTLGFAWEINDGAALLTGIGTVQDEDIVIPAEIFLSTITTGETQTIVEDPVNGASYPVVVAGSAFRNCDTLRTVTFADGVSVQDNSMCTPGQGMFTGCDKLEMVYNIPETVTSMAYAFSRCPALKETPVIPENVTNLSFCFSDCTALTTVHALGDSVENMQSAFSGCTALVAVPAIPNSVTDLDEAFRGCTALAGAPTLGTGVDSMRYTFAGCTALAETPVLPSGVRYLDHCFHGCTALTEMPVLPDTVESLNAFILGCSNISGSLTIPFGLIEYNQGFVPRLAFADCDSLDEILLDCCDNFYRSDELPSEIAITFLQEHLNDDLCPWCHIANSHIEIDGLSIVFDNTPEDIYQEMMDYVDNEVPDFLKDYCSVLTFTDNLGKYNWTYAKETYAGFSMHLPGTAYVKITARDIEYTLFHELAHCYDHNFSLFARFSSSSEWRTVYAEEEEILRKFYNEETYNGFSIEVKWKETFAIAVGQYYTNPEWMETNCPLAYEYLSNHLPE